MPLPNSNDEILVEGYYPGVIGKITEIHAVYYAENWGFDISFEIQVASELSQFMDEYQVGRDGFWAAASAGQFAGAIVIDGHAPGSDGARLRWFIVDPRFQGRGIGTALMSKAMAFSKEAGFSKVFLWTFKGLEAARRQYERAGFVLTEENQIGKWGTTILEQKYEITL